MGVGTGIEWADDTWNPQVGCSRTSPGCDHCYAMIQAPRQSNRGLYDGVAAAGDWTGRINLAEPDSELFLRPIRQTRPRRIFVNSMSDLFHEDVPAEHIMRVFAVMALAPQHKFQVLTKRAQRMKNVLTSGEFAARVGVEAARVATFNKNITTATPYALMHMPWPLANVWLGVSVESQAYTFRCRYLRETPAAVRWVSAEPLIGPVDLGQHLPELDWLVVGGESGQRARPMHPDWARSLRDQADHAGVPFLFKQWGQWSPDRSGWRRGTLRMSTHNTHQGGTRTTIIDRDGAEHTTSDTPRVGLPDGWAQLGKVGKHAAGRTLDGRTHDGYPQ